MIEDQECPACGHEWWWHSTVTGCDHVRDSLRSERLSLEAWQSGASHDCGCKARP